MELVLSTRMRRLVTVLVVAAWVQGVPPTAAHVPANQPCGRGHLTLAHNNVARIYKVHGDTEDWDYFGCSYARPRRSVSLASSDPYTLPPPRDLRLRGLFVGYHQESFSEGFVGGLTVRNVRTGRGQYLPGYATDFELRANGSYAYIRSPDTTTDGPFEVWRATRSAGKQRLDVGADIDSKSLSLTGTTLTWTRGGQQQSAQLD